jgi:hypothetical protein
MSTGDMLFDPLIPNRLWFAEGIGVWRANIPDEAASPKSVTFVSQSKGIEQLVANQILAPPSGKPLVASWDRPVFYIDDPNSYPSTHGPDNNNAIVMGWALDYATTNSKFIVGLMNWWGIDKSGYSVDGGRTWTTFAAHPPVTNTKIGGGIAASTPKNLVWAPSNNSAPYYTIDGGMTWMEATFPGVPSSGDTGWGFAYYLNRHIVAADRSIPGTFYIYNYPRGLYRSSDGGVTWARIYAREISPFSQFNASIQAVPGRAGHLFFTAGPQGGERVSHPAASPFMRSVDGGATWTAVKNVLEVRAFGFGRALREYPSIVICGWVDNKYGIWESWDDTATWSFLGDFPVDRIDDVRTIEGDKSVIGTVYVGFAGSGYVYGVSSDH